MINELQLVASSRQYVRQQWGTKYKFISRENGRHVGDIRFLDGQLYYAGGIDHHWFSRDVVRWYPVSAESLPQLSKPKS